MAAKVRNVTMLEALIKDAETVMRRKCKDLELWRAELALSQRPFTGMKVRITGYVSEWMGDKRPTEAEVLKEIERCLDSSKLIRAYFGTIEKQE